MLLFLKKNWPAFILPLLVIIRFLLEIPYAFQDPNSSGYLLRELGYFSIMAFGAFLIGYVFLVVYRTKNYTLNMLLGLLYGLIIVYLIPILFVAKENCVYVSDQSAMSAGGDWSYLSVILAYPLLVVALFPLLFVLKLLGRHPQPTVRFALIISVLVPVLVGCIILIYLTLNWDTGLPLVCAFF